MRSKSPEQVPEDNVEVKGVRKLESNDYVRQLFFSMRDSEACFEESDRKKKVDDWIHAWSQKVKQAASF